MDGVLQLLPVEVGAQAGGQVVQRDHSNDMTTVEAFEALTPQQRADLQVSLGFLPAPLTLASYSGMPFVEKRTSPSLGEPIAALPLQIFTYAISPYDEWHAQAWAGALVLIGLVLIISLVARFATRARHGGGHD